MELLAPAGNLEKLKTAVRFGADAVYCGGGAFSLRASDTAFSLDDLAKGIHFAHEHNCRVYLALNIFAFDHDLHTMLQYYREAAGLGIDAVIISDPGFLMLVNELGDDVKIHLSTQVNTMNSASVKFWQKQGVDRIVLARELSLDQIRKIKENVPEMELEAFVHGAMCMAYSGRCLLSSFFSSRSANRGDCNQPCRWEYSLKEKQREDEFTIEEDARGTYILNSRDLCMIEHVPELAAAGVDGLKIEGRMKTAYYVAAVTKAYRTALDSFHADSKNYHFNLRWMEELKKVSHRPFTTGFYFPEKNEQTERHDSSAYIRGYDFVGTVDDHNREKRLLKVKARNRFTVGDQLEILDPTREEVLALKVGQIISSKSGEQLHAAHNSYLVDIPLVSDIKPAISEHSILRRKTTAPTVEES
ncbi:MAG: peptidase U32 family protein [Bacillota bacterium]